MLNKLLVIISIFIYSTNLIGQPSYLQINKCWELNREDILAKEIASDNEILIIPLTNGISTYDKNFELLWSINTDALQPVKIFIINHEIIIIGKYSEETKQVIEKTNEINNFYKIISVSKQTGLINWQKNLSDTKESQIINYALVNQKLIMTTVDSKLIEIDLNNRHIESNSINSNHQIQNSIIFEKSLYFISSENQLIKFDLENSNLQPILKTEIQTSKIIYSDNQEMLLSNKKGEIIKYNLNKGKASWKTRIGAEISSIAKYKGDFLISSIDNYLYLISTEYGEFIWRKRFEGRIIGEIFEGNNLYISVLLNSNQGFITNPKTGKIINQIILENDEYFTGKPIISNENIILPYNKGIILYKFGKC